MNRFNSGIQQFLSCLTIFNVKRRIFVDKCQCIFCLMVFCYIGRRNQDDWFA